ncbi:MAG: ThiF family adenylyltransferase [Anaerolineales bacterium]|nr:ThiF family adenylyltransferase [Anaerolineales bacterium]
MDDSKESYPGQIRLTLTGNRVPQEKVIHIPNLKKDRLGTFDFISWWERPKVQSAKVMVVGAGALGNEVLKNLALMGVGNIFVTDFDRIEAANLSRSVLFREEDNGKRKAEVAARAIKELNPNINVQFFHGDINNEFGLGIYRRMDVVIGCLDNREARLSVNKACYRVNKPWVDGAIQELLGLVRVFVPGKGACFDCTLNEIARQEMEARASCSILAKKNILSGKVPTTPTISSIIGAIQAQEALKLIHKDNERLQVQPGKMIHFNGFTNDMFISAYNENEDCESHWMYEEIIERKDVKAAVTTLSEILEIARSYAGADAELQLDTELILTFECDNCGTKTPVAKSWSVITPEEIRCPDCGMERQPELAHYITDTEEFLKNALSANFLSKTLQDIGIPPLHIVYARGSGGEAFLELTGDLETTLHFSDFADDPEVGDTRCQVL